MGRGKRSIKIQDVEGKDSGEREKDEQTWLVLYVRLFGGREREGKMNNVSETHENRQVNRSK